jgi:hypothetical protein
MSAFDFDRFNGFARQSLDNLLFEDLWNHDIFNESDMHSAAYYYVREYFAKRESSRIYVRCEPQIAGMKPDIVVFESGRPIYAIEFKLFTRPDVINEELIWKDLDKLADLIDTFDSMRWGFFHLIYDSDESFSISDASLRRRDYKKVSVTTINARRREETKRRRVGYDEWRQEFDRLQELHRRHS